MLNNYDALNIIFQINKREDKEKLLQFSYDYFRCGFDIQTSLIKGWNSYITLDGVSRGINCYNYTPSEEFKNEANRLYKKVRRQKIIDSIL